MARCIIDYNEKYFMVYSSYLEIIMSYMSEVVVEKRYYNEEWLKEYDREVLIGKMGCFASFLNFNLDIYLNSPNRIKQFNVLIEDTKHKFLNIKEITYDDIKKRQVKSLLNTESRWIIDAFPFSIKGFLFVLQLIEDLINTNFDNTYNKKTIFLSDFE